MSRPTPPTYKTRNWPAYSEALKRRGPLTIWFDPAMVWEAAPTGKRGRQPDYSDAAIQTCLTMKVLFGMALRQTTGFVESLLRLIDLDWVVPDFSTLSRRQKTLKVNIPYRGSDGPLHLLIDSTGIKVEGEGEWNARKHGGTKRRVWRKIHIGIDEQTLEIRAAEFTTSDVGDAPMLPELLDQIPPEQAIASVTADGAFDTRKCHDAIAARGAAAIIPPRKNAKPRKPDTPGAIAPNEALRASKRFGRTIWRRWSGYHRRSRVETKMHCMKLLGQRLMARDFDRQVSEFQVRVAFLNGFTALGIPVTEAAGRVCPGKGEIRLSPDLCNRASANNSSPPYLTNISNRWMEPFSMTASENMTFGRAAGANDCFPPSASISARKCCVMIERPLRRDAASAMSRCRQAAHRPALPCALCRRNSRCERPLSRNAADAMLRQQTAASPPVRRDYCAFERQLRLPADHRKVRCSRPTVCSACCTRCEWRTRVRR